MTKDIASEKGEKNEDFDAKGYLVIDESSARRSRTCSLYISTICICISYFMMYFLSLESWNRSFSAK